MSSLVDNPEMVRGLLERAARALPADHVEEAEGWWLRRAPSCAWWAGTVLPHGHAGADELLRRVAQAERFYAGHGTVVRFQICPPACPDGLDALLAKRGYRRESLMSLQVASTGRVLDRTPHGALRIRLDERPTRPWLAVRHAVHGDGGDPRAERKMLDRIEQPCTYASAMIENDVVAVGRAVADTGWAGVFGMATLPRARGKGAARGLLAALAHWAGAHGTGRLYLQVERDNPVALRLYERTGFKEFCGYHYRAAG
ncbi:GNAT family N-acetyltransferase [Actinomadura macra]|uniref:GNAT family N-acetyltransferase n=1 Tax=Actinomadura macra TaxID=46164 RepID=UPI001FE1F990|nr:GNAT family N-acetyltransferase [Actinomadura macra]